MRNTDMSTPQLQQYSCTHLLTQAVCVLSDDIVRRLRNETSPDKATSRTMLWKWDAVPQDGSFVYSTAFMDLQTPRAAKRYEIGFHYDLSAEPQKKSDVKPLSKVETVLSLLGGFQEEAEFTCEARFEYDESTARRLFPIKPTLLDTDERLFDEVRGLTLVKTQNGQEVYRVEMRSPDLKQISLDVAFCIRLELNESLPSQVLEQASGIASKFIALEFNL
jgi:hypothetical protein